jgi:hypothetical protein
MWILGKLTSGEDFAVSGQEEKKQTNEYQVHFKLQNQWWTFLSMKSKTQYQVNDEMYQTELKC